MADNETIANDPAERIRMAVRWLLVCLYSVAGVLHLVAPDGFLSITPSWAPEPRLVILVTGLCEIAGAVALLTRGLRWWGGAMLALYAVCVFPANIKHAIEGIAIAGLPTSWWYHAPRLALQPVLVWAGLFAGGVIGWPVASRRQT